ncbi:protein charybde-like isoform X2 [Sarcoptes scabiei]|nr:protein charybde-like isoform X2 [Sarcoptes scabiei]
MKTIEFLLKETPVIGTTEVDQITENLKFQKESKGTDQYKIVIQRKEIREEEKAKEKKILELCKFF